VTARRRAAFLLALAALVLTACGGDEGAAGDGNVFANPGFEEGREPWFSIDSPAWGPPFELSTDRARSGASSALLELRSEQGGPARVYGVVQEVAPDELPETISGSYFVDRWEQGTPKQYLQFVVIVWGAANAPREVAQVGNHQIRYVLAGVDEPPIEVSNARFVMAGSGAPRRGEWVSFERNLREDFERLWGSVPEGFESVRVLFEVRWDGREPEDAPSAADVYYDDLYLGPAR
jgi:hypothetical protein